MTSLTQNSNPGFRPPIEDDGDSTNRLSPTKVFGLLGLMRFEDQTPTAMYNRIVTNERLPENRATAWGKSKEATAMNELIHLFAGSATPYPEYSQALFDCPDPKLGSRFVCRPDLLFKLSDGRKMAAEIKTKSPDANGNFPALRNYAQYEHTFQVQSTAWNTGCDVCLIFVWTPTDWRMFISNFNQSYIDWFRPHLYMLLEKLLHRIPPNYAYRPELLKEIPKVETRMESPKMWFGNYTVRDGQVVEEE